MVIDVIKLISLLLLLGGMLFYVVSWYPLFRNDDHGLNQRFHRRIARIMLIAGSLYLLGSLVQLLQNYRHSTQADSAIDITAFLLGPVQGLTLINLLLVPAIMFGFSRFSNLRTHNQQLWLGLIGMIVLFIHAAGSHAADDGMLAYLNNVMHLLAALTWAGGLCYFALVPWKIVAVNIDTYRADFWKLDQRFYSLVLLMFIVVVLTGSMLAFVHVHSVAALHGTVYGTILKLKLAMLALLILMLAVHLLKTGRILKSIVGPCEVTEARSVLMKFRWLITFEAVIVVVLLAGSAAMRSYEPPDIAPFLNPQTLNLSADGQSLRIEMQPVAGTINSVRLEIFLPPQLAGGDATQVFFSMYMPGGEIGLDEQEAIRVSADSYQGEATFPVPGDWQIDVTISAAGASTLQASTVFTVQKQPLVEDISTYLSLQSIVYNSSNMISFATGLLLVIIYSWLVLQARRGRVPQWILLAGTGGILFGLYLLLSVALVKTYPSTYRNNPQPLTASVVMRGQQAYTDTCADCHGTGGKGDGPWAIANRGSIPDLASPHIDVHTDGEIFWWITRGIPELDMPARDKQLNEDQRWEVINYIRSLRHGFADG